MDLPKDSINFLKGQLKNCLDNYVACQRDPVARPTRLLLLESLQGRDVHVYLTESSV